MIGHQGPGQGRMGQNGENTPIAFLGIGLMGLPMAEHLLEAGINLRVWNRTAAKAKPLGAYGAHVAASAHDAVAGAKIVISMLSDGGAVFGLVQDPLVQSALREDALWIDMSSTRRDEAVGISKSLQAQKVEFIDAPVSGGTKGAADASLAIMVGAQTHNFERAKPVLKHLGNPVHVGGVGSGQLAKLANQLIVALTIGAVAEAVLLLEKGGADAGAVRDALKGGFADSVVLQQHGRRMSERDFEPGGLSRLQLKDLENVLIQARETGIELPMTMSIRDRFDHYVKAMGGGEKDHSGLFEELLARN